MKRYIGITIGPIAETMSLTSSPVGLWAASYMFSFLSKTICECLVADGICEQDIISPYFVAEEPLLNQKDGVGMFYDRIIIESETYEVARITEIRKAALLKLAEAFDLDFSYLDTYVMISSVAFTAENPLEESGKILDSLELATPFVAKETQNELLALFFGDRYGKNNRLRTVPAVTELEAFQLKKTDDNFISLPELVRTGAGFKKYDYYAIVRADGDNMNKIVASLESKDAVREFSKHCLTYCANVSKIVKRYGGVTIYAGGDDLLAILPCESADGRTPMHFTQEANSIFKEHFASYGEMVSLSFGIAIAFNRFPLYESLADSSRLLFGIAKAEGKNNVAIRLQRHSGQTDALVLPNEKVSKWIEIYDYVRTYSDRGGVVLGAASQVRLFADWFDRSETDTEAINLFKNIFDASEQKKHSDFLHRVLPELFLMIRNDKDVQALINEKRSEMPATFILYIWLSQVNFFFEKGGAEEV